MRKSISIRVFKMIGAVFICVPFLLSSINFFKSNEVYATNALTNPSFTGGSTGWTLSTTVYDSSIYQDTAGSIKTETAIARKATATGTATQVISAQIIGGSTVDLSFYWSKQCVQTDCITNTIEIRRILSGSSSTIWSDTSIPSAGAQTAWQQVSSVDVSSYFTTTGTYTFEVYVDLEAANDKTPQALAWVDVINLDVTPPDITVGTTGTQTSSVSKGQSDAYLGGAFTFVRDGGSTAVTSITVSETGTIADANISGLILYYKQEASCSTSIPGDATQFNSTAGTFSSGSSTVTGSINVGTSQVCVYVEADIGSGASIGDTILIQITNPSTQITASAGTVSPATVVAISGTTTLAGVLSMDIVDASDVSVSSPSIQFSSSDFSWSVEQTTGTLGTSTEKIKVSNGTASSAWTLSIAATGGSGSVDTYYVDGNDAISDPDNKWSPDSDAFDGITTTFSALIQNTVATTSANYLMGEGTNAPGTGGEISQVRARVFGGGTNFVETGGTVNATLYTDNLGEELGEVTATSTTNTNHDWGSYVTLATPTGGWTWTKVQVLEAKVWGTSGSLGNVDCYRIDIEISSGTLWESTNDSYEYDGAQADGRLQVDSSNATITPGGGCTSTGLSKQSAAYFVNGSVESIDLIVADGTADTSCEWDITGIELTQDIPAEQPIGDYSIGMTLTVAAV